MSLAIVGFIYIGWMFGHLAFLANSTNAYGYLLYILFATEINDVAAFTCGKLFGKRQFRSNISPKKTPGREPLAARWWFPWRCRGCCDFPLLHFGATQLILTGLIVGIGGQLGDLSISVIKRDVGIKDMGARIPGHGGILDRIDSLILCSPPIHLPRPVGPFSAGLRPELLRFVAYQMQNMTWQYEPAPDLDKSCSRSGCGSSRANRTLRFTGCACWRRWYCAGGLPRITGWKIIGRENIAGARFLRDGGQSYQPSGHALHAGGDAVEQIAPRLSGGGTGLFFCERAAAGHCRRGGQRPALWPAKKYPPQLGHVLASCLPIPATCVTLPRRYCARPRARWENSSSASACWWPARICQWFPAISAVDLKRGPRANGFRARASWCCASARREIFRGLRPARSQRSRFARICKRRWRNWARHYKGRKIRRVWLTRICFLRQSEPSLVREADNRKRIWS